MREVSKSENSYNKLYKRKDNIKIAQYSLKNKFIKEWNSIVDIEKEKKFKIYNIQACCNGNRKTAHNFIWKNLNVINDISKFKEIITNDDNKFSNYKINSDGVIITKKNNVKMNPCKIGGYYVSRLSSDNNTKKNYLVHRLVAMTFIKNPNNYKIVNHKDKNKLNNNAKNLEWCTILQNTIHSCGKKVNQIDIKTNNIIKTFSSINSARVELNKKHVDGIGLVCAGKQKTAYGYKWEFA